MSMRQVFKPAKERPYIQKYGGTSLGSVERIQTIARRIARLKQEGFQKQAIVVSAMSGETNRLVDLMNQVNPDSPRDAYDLAVSAGEQVSVALLSAALAGQGLTATPLLAYQLGVRTNGLHSRARIESIETEALEQAWSAGSVPVIAGFQGVSKEQRITTLGRGGSDTSAVALAVACSASQCEINTDVAGVFTADPRYVPGARVIEVLDFEVALEMASLGSKVLHPRCVELAAKFHMPIKVRHSFDKDDSKGTWVMDTSVLAKGREDGLPKETAANTKQALESPVVAGVTLDRAVARVVLSMPRTSLLDSSSAQVGFSQVFGEVFAYLAQRGVNVDVIVHNDLGGEDCRIGFTVEENDLRRTEQDIQAWMQSTKDPSLTRVLKHMKVDTEGGLAKVSIVGVGMHSHPGVASRMFALLAGESIDIRMISTSEIKVSCVIAKQDGEKAAGAVHAGFFKDLA